LRNKQQVNTIENLMIRKIQNGKKNEEEKKEMMPDMHGFNLPFPFVYFVSQTELMPSSLSVA